MSHSHHSGNVMRRRGLRMLFLYALALLIGSMWTVQAQPNLNFKRVTVNWPTIELYFSVGCNGQPVYNLQKSNFRIMDHGQEVNDFTLWCPDPMVRCAISVALVFDASGSMSGSGNAGAKQAGHTFIDLMDGVIDEAAILHFNQYVQVAQQMTTVKPALHAAVDNLVASGATAVWDGAYAGIVEIINNGVNHCRAVIVLTDGGDNSSTRTVAEIISLANRHRIRVYTVGLGTAINATELELIALLTGGRYYQTPNAGQIASIYQEIANIIFQGFQECMITYERQCADGAIGPVDLQLQNLCGGNDLKTKTYRAPLDSTTFSDLQFTLNDAGTIAGEEVVVDLAIETLQPVHLYPFNFTLNYDRQMMQLLSADVAPGAPLSQQAVSTAAVAGGTEVMIQSAWDLPASRTILRLRFQTSPLPAGMDSLRVPLTVSDAGFLQGCRIPRFNTASVLIERDAATLDCRLNIPEVISDSLQFRYDPMPVPITYEVTNRGTIASTAVEATLSLPAGLALAGPDAPDHFTKTLQPAVLQPGETGSVTWMVLHPLTQIERRYEVRAHAGQYPGDPGVVCSDSLIIPALDGLLLSPRCHVPDSLTYDDNLLGYTPNPFSVRLTCVNAGSRRVRNVTGTVILPPGMQLDPSTPQPTLTFSPAELPPWVTGDPVPEVEWKVTWTMRDGVDRTPVLQFRISGEDLNGLVIDTVSTSCSVRIPGVTYDWHCALDIPDSLGLKSDSSGVEPNPFTVRYTLTNQAGVPARVDRVRLNFRASDLALHPSSPNPVLVQLNRLLAPNEQLSLEWVLFANETTTRRLTPIAVTSFDDGGDSLECADILPVAAIPLPTSHLSCGLSIPPIVVDSVNHWHIPMPFPVTVTVTNLGNATAENIWATIVPPPGYRIALPDPVDRHSKELSPPQLTPGQSGTARWLLEHDPEPVSDTSHVDIIVTARNLGLTQCGAEIILPGIPGLPFSFTLAAGGGTAQCEGDSLVLDALPGQSSYLWSTQETTRTIFVRRTGSYWCRTVSSDGRPGYSDTVDVIFSPVPPQPMITRSGDSLITDDAFAWQWFLDGLALPGADTRAILIENEGRYEVRVQNASGCTALSAPFDVSVLGVEAASAVIEDISLYPNPSTGQVTVGFTGDVSVPVQLVVTDVLGREVISRVGIPAAGRMHVDLSHERTGMYYLRVQYGDQVLKRVINIQR